MRLINAFGPNVDHVLVSAEPGALGAGRLISKEIAVGYSRNFPSLQGRPSPGRLRRMAQAMRDFDLILTYNWGAMDAVMAHTVFARAFGLPALIHHEDGFNADEAVKLKSSRNWYRRVALGRAAALVVPSQVLERVALDRWAQPKARVHRIPNGLPTADYAKFVRKDALPGLIKRPGEFWLGTLAGLREVKNLPRLVRAFSGMPEQWQLVILGQGPEEARIRAEALECGVAHRVHLPGFVADPASAIGLFDLFALSSDSEQFPLSVVEAMAAGLAVAAPDVGDIAQIVSAPNAPFIAAAGEELALADAMMRLAGDSALRGEIGAANRIRARAEFDETQMIATYRVLYNQVLGCDVL